MYMGNIQVGAYLQLDSWMVRKLNCWRLRCLPLKLLFFYPLFFSPSIISTLLSSPLCSFFCLFLIHISPSYLFPFSPSPSWWKQCRIVLTEGWSIFTASHRTMLLTDTSHDTFLYYLIFYLFSTEKFVNQNVHRIEGCFFPFLSLIFFLFTSAAPARRLWKYNDYA